MGAPNQQAVGQKRLRPVDEDLGNGVQPPVAKHKRPDEEDEGEHRPLCDALRQRQRELIDTEAVRDSVVAQRLELEVRQDIGQQLVLERISAMSDEDRAKFADRLERSMNRNFRKKK